MQPTHTPILRPIAPTDNAVVAQVIRQVMTEFGCVGPGFSIEDPEVDAMYEAYLGGRAAFYVIEHEGRVMGCGGFATLAGNAGDTCELQKMYFLPELRGMGMGARLIDHCIAQARLAGYTRMYLETVNRMHAANALYQSRGFVPLPQQQGCTGHGGCDTFYERIL
jgi:putative acetyltransferase